MPMHLGSYWRMTFSKALAQVFRPPKTRRRLVEVREAMSIGSLKWLIM
jgi:hypothetical protein